MIMHGPWYIHEDVVHVKHVLVVHLLKSNFKLKAPFLENGTEHLISRIFNKPKASSISILVTKPMRR